MKTTYVIHDNYACHEDFIRDLHETFDSGETIHDGRNTVRSFPIDGEKIIVKRFKRPNLFNRIIYTFIRGSKAVRGYNNALRLLSLGVDTPRPIAYVDVREGGLTATSYLVTEHTSYAPVADILEEPMDAHMDLLKSFAVFTAQLHKMGVCHDDYNLGNVLYRETEQGRFDFMLIDVNRMRFGRMSRRDCFSNIKRTCANPDFTYFFVKEYSATRRWNIYRSIAGFAIFRSVFERRRKKKARLKNRLHRVVAIKIHGPKKTTSMETTRESR